MGFIVLSSSDSTPMQERHFSSQTKYTGAPMRTRCERHGQTEIGIIEHEGREFSALGANVNGPHIAVYTTRRNGQLVLTTWCGATMLSCRSSVIETFWTGAFAVLFRLTGRRFIAGYSLGEGMLFRGELLVDFTEDDAKDKAMELSVYWAEADADDEAQFEEDYPTPFINEE
jgi:hypothetical protein